MQQCVQRWAQFSAPSFMLCHLARPRSGLGTCLSWTKELKRHQSLNVIFTGYFCLWWCSNLVGSEFGQKQSVKLLQNMVYNTTQHLPTPPPPTAKHCLYILCVYFGKGGRGRGGQREGRGATVHKYSSFVHGGNSSQVGSKIPTMSECISSL